MFVVGAGWARRRPRAAGLPLTLALGQVASARALGATMAAFVLGFAALAALAVGAHHALGHDGPLWVAFGLPWVVPLMFQAGRWGQLSGADGALTVEADAVTLRWGAVSRRIPRAEAQALERVTDDRSAWVLEVRGPHGGIAVAWPSQGFLGERFCAERIEAGAQRHPQPPIGAAPLLADLHEVRSLVAHLAPTVPPEPT